jgi:alkanesulfonate monooxygenase SsuD/methylene tetrahydromethanopterin reductase-like flavin-dependent oxidoreductase (luciferase family)
MHLAAIARSTERVRLGQMVAAVPYRTPLLTARLASDLDHLSDGRSILGLGIGWNAKTTASVPTSSIGWVSPTRRYASGRPRWRKQSRSFAAFGERTRSTSTAPTIAFGKQTSRRRSKSPSRP